jgi:hypothetical protein
LWAVDDGLPTGILDLNFIAAPTMLIRASILAKIGGFNPTLMAVDHEFGFRAAVLGAHFAYLNRSLIYRHVYSSSNSQRPIKAHLEILEALEACRRVCVISQRTDLLPHVARAFYRTHLHLMVGYGQAGQRAHVWKSYRNMLSYTFRPKDLVLFLLCMGGAGTISWFEEVRRIKVKWTNSSR